MAIQRPKGTQDIIPGAVENWHYLEAQIKEICGQFGFREIRTPVFEATELFRRGVGETTDIVNKEMYTFLDKGRRSLTLRPEGTASICRAYVENKLYSRQQPVKLYYLGPMFRYENTQAGRFRQFHQFGAEVLGGKDPLVDAEVIQLVMELYRRIGLKKLELHINSVGCPVCRAGHREELQKFLLSRKNELCAECQARFERNPMRILDCKNEECRQLSAGAPTTPDHLCPECREHFDQVQRLLELGGTRYQIDPRMVRGLDYYQKTAFEVMAEGIGAQSAICGGGRYDGLVEEIGGPPTPGMGFAMGIERILAVLEHQNINIEEESPLKTMVVALGPEARPEGFRLLGELRRAGFAAEMDFLGRGLKSQLKTAGREGAGYALILGEDELAENIVIIRDMRLGEQSEVARSAVLEYLQQEIKKECKI